MMLTARSPMDNSTFPGICHFMARQQTQEITDFPHCIPSKSVKTFVILTLYHAHGLLRAITNRKEDFL